MQVSNFEAIPMILSLIEAGRMDIAQRQLEHMARLADAFGQDVEIAVLPHDELTGQYQVMVVNAFNGEVILHEEPLPPEAAWVRGEQLAIQIPNSTLRMV